MIGNFVFNLKYNIFSPKLLADSCYDNSVTYSLLDLTYELKLHSTTIIVRLIVRLCE